MAIKKIVFIGFMLLFQSFIFAQSSMGNQSFWREVRYGGGLGIGFFNNGYNLSVSPSAIYPATSNIMVGASLNLNFAKYNNDKLLAYGGSLLSFYNPIPPIQLSAELEQLRINRTFDVVSSTIKDNYWSTALFFGLGYSSRSVTFGLRYNVLHNDTNSIYSSALLPFVRVYF